MENNEEYEENREEVNDANNEGNNEDNRRYDGNGGTNQLMKKSKYQNIRSTVQKHSHRERSLSAPLQLLNELQEFKYSPTYINLEKAFLYANGLNLFKVEGHFDIESEEGGEICRKFLRQIENLMRNLGVKGESREFRKKFSKAYYYLFEDGELCYLTEILDSAQETSPFLIVNAERFSFSSAVIFSVIPVFTSSGKSSFL